MKLNSIITGHLVSNTLMLAFVSTLSTNVLADNKEALKDAIGYQNIKVAEAKPSELKSSEQLSKALVDADFKKLDSNSDEKISLKEAAKDKVFIAQFDSADVNHDGMVSADEYAFYKTNSANIKPTDGSVMPATN